jgi:hypothetical protein
MDLLQEKNTRALWGDSPFLTCSHFSMEERKIILKNVSRFPWRKEKGQHFMYKEVVTSVVQLYFDIQI